MANSPLVSIRIPPETLKRLDELAQQRYPSRRAGKSPNRSQVILDAIEQFLAQQELMQHPAPNLDEDKSIQVFVETADVLMPYPPAGHSRASEQDEITPKNSSIQLHEQKLAEPPIREYINWWFDYFSHLKRLSNLWIDR